MDALMAMSTGAGRHAKGWGHEEWLHNSPKYCAKILKFRPGGKCSFHFHCVKDETFYVIKGKFLLELLDTVSAKANTRTLDPGDFQFIPHGMPHRVTCLGKSPGEIFEASSQHFEEDSYRIAPGDSQANAGH